MNNRTVLDEVEAVPDHLNQLFSMLERWRQRLDIEYLAVPEGHAPEASLARQLTELSKASVSMAKEMRHWVGKVKDTSRNLSIEDQVKVSLRLIMNLSKGDRLKTYALMKDLEKQSPDGGISIHVQ
jgi:isochorismate synthase EntC